MKASAPTLDTSRFTLIQNQLFPEIPEIKASETELVEGQEIRLLSKDAMKYLIRALEGADAIFSREIESLLAKAARQTPQMILGELIKALNSEHANVKSTCAMVLIRLGQHSVSPIKEFYLRNLKKKQPIWIAEFILDQLGEALPPFCVQQELTHDAVAVRTSDALYRADLERALEKVS